MIRLAKLILILNELVKVFAGIANNPNNFSTISIPAPRLKRKLSNARVRLGATPLHVLSLSDSGSMAHLLY